MDCDQIINNYEKSLKDSLEKLNPIQTYIELADCNNQIIGGSILGSILLPGIGGILGSQLSYCSKNANFVLKTTNSLKEIQKYREIQISYKDNEKYNRYRQLGLFCKDNKLSSLDNFDRYMAAK